jgi:hypothetical protein
MKNIFKSIGAILLGMIIVIILSYGTDALLRAMGIMSATLPMYGSVLLILFVITYRSIYNVIGSYVIARFAPNHPMTHVLIVGVLGFIGGLAGTFATMNMHVGPAWYGFAIAFLSIPTTWIGGKLFLATKAGK